MLIAFSSNVIDNFTYNPCMAHSHLNTKNICIYKLLRHFAFQHSFGNVLIYCILLFLYFFSFPCSSPILIVHDTDDKNGNGISEAMDIYQKQKSNMEINNNNDDNVSPYLHNEEDKSDNKIVAKSDDNVHNSESNRNIRSLRIDVTTSVVSEKNLSNFENRKIHKEQHVNHPKKFCRDKNMELQSDNDRCVKLLNDDMTQANENDKTIFNRNNESAECLINNKITIVNNDSERLNLTKEICAKNNTPVASQRVSSLIRDDQITSNVTQSADGESFY